MWMSMTIQKWRIQLMSEPAIIDHMIAFVEEKERQLQANKRMSESQIKSEAIKSILDELERETSDED